MRFHKILLMMVCALVLSASVYAAAPLSFIVGYAEDDTSIFADEVATLEITITNRDFVGSSYQIYSEDPRWILYTNPNQVFLQPGDSEVVEVTLDPTTAIVQHGNYGVPIAIKSVRTEEVASVRPSIQIQSDRFRDYAASVFLDVEIGEEGVVDPRDDITVKLRVVNKNPLNYDNFTVILDSSFFYDSYETSLGPRGDLVKTLTYDINQRQSPEDITVEVTMIGDGSVIGSPRTETFSIIPVYPRFLQDKATTEAFLTKHWEVTLTNDGNVEQQEQILIPVSSFATSFTDTSHGYEERDYQGVHHLAFDIQLQPGESTTLVVDTNLRPFVFTLVTILVIIILIIILYYVFRSPVVISRHAQIIKSDGGAASKLKVLVNIKNRTNRAIENVKVFERLPHITEVEETFEVGTVKPSKVMKKSRKGTLVRWDFSTLEPYEERIITYKIQSKLSILGDITLPATTVQFAAGGNRTRKVTYAGMDKKN